MSHLRYISALWRYTRDLVKKRIYDNTALDLRLYIFIANYFSEINIVHIVSLIYCVSLAFRKKKPLKQIYYKLWTTERYAPKFYWRTPLLKSNKNVCENEFAWSVQEKINTRWEYLHSLLCISAAAYRYLHTFGSRYWAQPLCPEMLPHQEKEHEARWVGLEDPQKVGGLSKLHVNFKLWAVGCVATQLCGLGSRMNLKRSSLRLQQPRTPDRILGARALRHASIWAPSCKEPHRAPRDCWRVPASPLHEYVCPPPWWGITVVELDLFFFWAKEQDTLNNNYFAFHIVWFASKTQQMSAVSYWIMNYYVHCFYYCVMCVAVCLLLSPIITANKVQDSEPDLCSSLVVAGDILCLPVSVCIGNHHFRRPWHLNSSRYLFDFRYINDLSNILLTFSPCLFRQINAFNYSL